MTVLAGDMIYWSNETEEAFSKLKDDSEAM
jgi:hypothetical protein